MNLVKPMFFIASFTMFFWALPSASRAATDEALIKGKVTVTSSDFEADMMRIPAPYRHEVRASMDRVTKIVDNLFVNRALAAEAIKMGLDKNEVIKKRLQIAQEAALANIRLEQLINEAKLPDFEPSAKEFYKVNADKFSVPATVKASHILITTKDRTKEEALKLAQDVRAQALAGNSFEDLAEKYSEDASAKRNKGDLGYFAAANMVKPFADAAFAMDKPGAISETVETQFGYHIILLKDKKPANTRSFDEVKLGIMGDMAEKFKADIRAKKISEIRQDKNNVVNNDAINRLKTTLDLSQVKPINK